MRWLKTLFGNAANRVSLAPAQQATIDDWHRLSAADLAVAHEQQRYVVVDVETSGLNMKKPMMIRSMIRTVMRNFTAVCEAP